jgi:hypothetical protein
MGKKSFATATKDIEQLGILTAQDWLCKQSILLYREGQNNREE